jgi:hypothetical protein
MHACANGDIEGDTLWYSAGLDGALVGATPRRFVLERLLRQPLCWRPR